MPVRTGRPSFAVLVLIVVSLLLLPDRGSAQAVDDIFAALVQPSEHEVFVSMVQPSTHPLILVKKEEHRDRGKHLGRCKHGKCELVPIVPDTPPVTTVTPEPATLALLGTGLLGLAGWRRRR